MNIQQDPLNLIICGIGGQGNILISRLIGRTLTDKGYFVTIGETFGAAQRGGAVFSSLRISQKKYYGPLVQQGQADIVLSLEPLESLRILNNYGNPDVITVTNSLPIYPVGVLSKRTVYPDLEKLKEMIRNLSSSSWFLNATEIAVELGAPIVTNIIMTGALIRTKKMPIGVEDVKESIKSTFPASKVDLNLKALSRGYDAVH
jgi:indolepyruvate ferredoxin oxidoreductase beta subunit